MKWATLLKDIKEKVGLSYSHPHSPPPSASTSPSSSSYPEDDFPESPTRDKNELELEFKRFWEEFCLFSSEKEKEAALNMTLDIFCRLVKQTANITQLVTMLVEAHIFSFVVGRAFVTDIEKLKINCKTRSLDVGRVLCFFSDVSKDGFSPGSNLLYTVEVLVSGAVDKQSLLDSGIFCCLIRILNALISPDGSDQPEMEVHSEEPVVVQKSHGGDVGHIRRLEVEGSIVHIMKALATHPSAAQSLIEDDSLELLFHMVATKSVAVFSQFKEGLVPLHTIQLHRHAMQILSLLLLNDSGTTAKYIRRHHLVKILLMAVKDFDPDCGDPAYTMGIIDLLLECVELSSRHDAGGIRLREDIHNAHGYQFLVQFALLLSTLQNDQDVQSVSPKFSDRASASVTSYCVGRQDSNDWGTSLLSHLSPSLSRLLDALVNLSQIGPSEHTIGDSGSKSTYDKVSGFSDESWEDSTKVKDLEAIRTLQDIFLKADNTELQAEVLNRMFKIFSSHLENYKECQELRTMPRLILNMEDYPPLLQDIILKILEYVVTVVNCVPEQELLSLCWLLQQKNTLELKQTILSFFVKLLSFDQQYKKVFRELGLLDVLLDDLKQHGFLSGSEEHSKIHAELERKSSSSSFQKHMDSRDTIISSPKLLAPGAGKFSLFGTEGTISVAWDCMVSLLKKAEVNQSPFRSANGVKILLPFLASDIHRSGVLRTLSVLIIEDVTQAHPEELGALVEILQSGMVSTLSGFQYKLQGDAKCDILGALWRILGVNSAAQRVFGEATGFSLPLTMIHNFQSDGHLDSQPSLTHMKVFTFLLRAVTAGVCGSSVNRIRLHTVISSQTFSDLLTESGLLCVDYEKQVIQLLLELALEIVIPPSCSLIPEYAPSSDMADVGSANFLLSAEIGSLNPSTERVYNAGAVQVLIRCLLLFTPKVQFDILTFIEKLVHESPFNQENLTSIGCIKLLLETVYPFIMSSSSLLTHALQIVEVLGAYRLSSSELRIVAKYIMQTRLMSSGYSVVSTMERLINMEDTTTNISLAPYVEMDMRKFGHASFQVSLGDRSWPPAAGYSFVCWFQYRNFLKSQVREPEQLSKTSLSKRRSISTRKQVQGNVLRLFSVGSPDDGNTLYAELYLQDDGVLTLATGNSGSLSFSGLELDEGKWHHLVIVHSKPNALAGLFQASVACIYLNGKLRHTGKLGYSPSPLGNSLQVTIGTPIACSKVNELSWKLRCCYLFEEVLSSGSICFMYILGRGYRGTFQDADLLQFVPSQACGGDSMAILDSLDAELPLASNMQRPDTGTKQGNLKADGSGIVWDLDRLQNLSLQLSGKKLIFAFDGTSSEAYRAVGTLSMFNLVDPTSAAASPIGGIPRFGRLHGDSYICRQCVIGDSLRTVGGITVILALVEAAETRNMLHMALALLSCALHQNPQNVRDMQAYRGYHLLSLFLHRRMHLLDMKSLEMFFQIAACEAAVSEPQKTPETPVTPFPTRAINESNYEPLTVSKFEDEISSDGSHDEMDDFSVPQDSLSHISELESNDIPTETSSCIVLSNADMVEHVLLDWTLWVASPVSLQISLIGFLERLVSLHWYSNHNITVLRKINLVQHLLVTLQRGDVEVPVLEKLVELIGIILENGFLGSEMELVVRFVIMTFDPPKVTQRHQIFRESMGKHVIVRNMLLEMLIDLQMSIDSEDFVEQWHKLVSSKLITYFLDESVHPTSMRWIMTLLGVCLSSSQTFVLKFRSGRGYQGLARVLPSFYDSPEIYYTLFCLIFGKPVYPRLPEVRMLDFHAIMPSNGNSGELKFIELLESVTAMAKSTFDRLNLQLMVAYQTGNLSQISAGLMAELVEESEDMIGVLQGDALMHKTYAARLMGGEAAAPAAAMSILRFMVDLAKICHPFSAICRRFDFLESCIDLYFSCVRAACAVKMAKNLSVSTDERNLNESDDTHSLQHTLSSLLYEQEQSNTSTSVGSFSQGQISTSSEGMFPPQHYPVNDVAVDEAISSRKERNKSLDGVDLVFQTSDGNSLDSTSKVPTGGKVRKASRVNLTLDVHAAKEYSNSSSSIVPNSPGLSEKSISKGKLTPGASPVFALASWLGSAGHNEAKSKTVTTPSMGSSVSVSEVDTFQYSKSSSQQWPAASAFFALNPKLLLEIDESGYGGGPCSGSATAVLDFIAEVLADVATEQLKAAQFIESILEMIPSYVDVDCALVFQGLCLSRLMNFLERRLLRDDEEDEKKLDKTRWSLNLDQLCWMFTDRVYMGAFPKPGAVLGTLEFMLSMLQLANKDGRIEEAAPSGKGLLYITRGTRQLETYVYALLKNTNRMIMYCFLPSFLSAIGEDDLVEVIRSRMEAKKISYVSSSHGQSGINICSVLQLLIAHKRIIFCPSNSDTDLNCCLCLNLITLLRDRRHMAQSLSIDIIKHLLVHRRAALEEFLVSKLIQGKRLDVLHGGFDKMLTGSLSLFFEWLQKSEQTINKVLDQCAAIAWVQYIAGSSKFPGVRIKSMEDRRRKEMGRKTLDTTKSDLRHWEQINERRYALGLVRDALSTELRVIRQDKYGWVLHAESEWQVHLQQLVHERGIFPIQKPPHTEEPEWQLCPIEGPYRMRKKLERCKLKMDMSQIVLCDQVERNGTDLSTGKLEQGLDASETDSIFHLLSDGAKRKCFDGDEYDESVFMDADDVKEGETPSTRIGWNDDRASSTDETSLHSALEFGVKSSAVSVPISDSFQGRSDSGSLMQSSSGVLDEMKPNETKLDKELYCNGEYLVRPYLEHLEKIRFKYNCERVVGLDKHDGIFLIGELCLYVIENFYIDKSGNICEKQFEDDLSVIDQAMGVQKDVTLSMDFQSKSSSSCGVTVKSCFGGRAWAYNGGAWGKEKATTDANLPHLWHMWKLESIHELLKRDYQLRPVAVEIFSMDGCNDLLVFHKKEREEVFRNLVAMNLPRNMLDTTISGLSKQETTEGGRLFKIMAKSFSKRWQNGEISNFQYLMHLNTLAGRGYSDLTQYPVFPWVLADYERETLDLADPSTFRKLEKPMGCQTAEGEEEFKKRYESWDDPEIPKFHYGSHYSSAGIVLFYLLRLPPFSAENQKLQGGQFDHADRLFNSVKDTWLSAAGNGNTSDVKELIPEFFYMPEFLENRFNLDLGEKQSGEKVEGVVLPPWANGSAREFIRKHRQALESEYVSENLHNWIDLIFGYKQRGKAAEKAVNVFYHYTYEGSVDIDAVSDPVMKASILSQINHFGQTPKQLFVKPHVKRRSDKKLPSHPLRNCNNLVSREIRKTSSSITKIYSYNEKILVTGSNNLLKPRMYNKYVAWGFPDRSLRFMTYDQDRLLSTHENLHGGEQIQCAAITHDGQTLVTGGEDGVVCVWQISEEKLHSFLRLRLQKALCAHTAKITCLCVSQSYMVIVSGSDDCTVILWDLSGLLYVNQLPEFPAPVSAIFINDLTGEIMTASGIQLAIWSINGDCIAAVNTTQLPSDIILSVTSATFSDWLDTNWYVTGHQSGAVKVWQMEHFSVNAGGRIESPTNEAGVRINGKVPEYRLLLHKVLKSHKDPVTSLHLTSNLKQLLSGDSEGHLLSWTLLDENLRTSFKKG